MDLDRPVTYRGLDLNQQDPLQPAQPLSGYVVNEARFEPVEGWGYREKRSLQDGYDASDVYLGMRVLNLRGTVYTSDKPTLHDRIRLLRATLTPTLAFGDNPNDKGFLPLGFEVPTLDTDDWDTGYIPLVMYARPAEQPGFSFVRDAAYGKGDGYSIPWMARVEAKDPLFYHPVANEVAIDSATKDDSFHNRGDYPAALNFVLHVGAGDSVQKVFTFTGAGTRMHITVPSDALERTVRVDSVEKVVSYTKNGEQTLRMDLIEFDAGLTWPRIPPGDSVYDWTITGGVPDPTESKAVWYETFA